MAIQAQYPFLPDFQTIRDQQINSHVGQQQIGNGEVISDLKSGLTCNNASGSRKRNRDTANTAAAMIQQFQIPNPLKIPKTTTTTISIPNNTREIPCQQNRMLGSAGTSTSGRLVPQHFTEIDTLIHLHNVELRSGLDEIQKRHHTELFQILEARAAKKITEKDAEIGGLKSKQAELEARLKQAAVENQIWFVAARNSESLVTGLRATLDQALRYGGGCHVASGQAEDAESGCGGGDGDDRKQLRKLCRVCRERDVSALLLPCRHLCLCSECEPAVGSCPICYETKNVGLQVFLE